MLTKKYTNVRHSMSTEFERQPGQADKHRHLTAQGSDNDANERPVREKLRDTSIAPKPDFERLPSQGAINHEKPSAIDKKDTSCTISSVSNAVPHIDLHRGRPGRKRSFNDIEANAAVEAWSAEPHENRVKGHPRKRSRDAPNVSKSDDKTPNDHSYQEASTGNIAFLNQFRAISASPTHTHGEHGEKGGLKDDREEILGCDAAFSPRKKRSREQVDTDIQREQKIVATEEAKASRGSDEIQRTDERSQTASQSTRSAHESEAVKLETEPTDLIDPVPIESHPEKVTRDFLSPSTVESATRQFTAADTSAQFQGPAITTKSSNAFSASGLAASARNPTSGFGDLGSSFTSRAGQSIFSASSFSPMNDLEKGRTIAGAQSTSIGSFGSPKPSAFTLGPSPGSLGPSPFQTSNFGVGLSVQGILSSGSTVRSFAASNGDVDLGKPKSGSKSSAFGAPEKSGEESNSDNEVEAASESGGDASTQNLKFQQKEGNPPSNQVHIAIANTM